MPRKTINQAGTKGAGLAAAIDLNFINRTEDLPSANLVVCQHNAAAEMGVNPVAWKVISELRLDEPQRLVVPHGFDVAAQDADGNALADLPARPGQAFEVVNGSNGQALRLATTPALTTDEVEVRNVLEAGAISANIYRDGALLATKGNLAPGQTTCFKFFSHVYVGLAAHAEAGQVLSAAVASLVTTRINLLGISAADVVLTSSGESAALPNYHLENITC